MIWTRQQTQNVKKLEISKLRNLALNGTQVVSFLISLGAAFSSAEFALCAKKTFLLTVKYSKYFKQQSILLLICLPQAKCSDCLRELIVS